MWRRLHNCRSPRASGSAAPRCRPFHGASCGALHSSFITRSTKQQAGYEEWEQLCLSRKALVFGSCCVHTAVIGNEPHRFRLIRKDLTRFTTNQNFASEELASLLARPAAFLPSKCSGPSSFLCTLLAPQAACWQNAPEPSIWHLPPSAIMPSHCVDGDSRGSTPCTCQRGSLGWKDPVPRREFTPELPA